VSAPQNIESFNGKIRRQMLGECGHRGEADLLAIDRPCNIECFPKSFMVELGCDSKKEPLLRLDCVQRGTEQAFRKDRGQGIEGPNVSPIQARFMRRGRIEHSLTSPAELSARKCIHYVCSEVIANLPKTAGDHLECAWQ
jgi:hypothetical protein